MIQKLVWANIQHRPLRTFLTALLVAIPVTLVLTLTGLSKGMIDDYTARSRGGGADIVIRPKGSTLLQLGTAPIPEAMLRFVNERPHVTISTGLVLQTLGTPTSAGAGIDLEAFNRMSGGFKYLSGGPFQSPDDVIIDKYYADEKKLHTGDFVEFTFATQKWRVCGIVEPGKLYRVFVDIRKLQDLTANNGKVQLIYLKVDDKRNIPAVIEDLKSKLEGYPIYSMEEFTSLLNYDTVPLLSSFTHVVIGISIFIGFSVVCLSMYMAVLQRTREIGILKSLGASKWYVISTILREAIMLAIVGTLLGIGMSFGTKWTIKTFLPASFPPAIDPSWWPVALLISLIGAVLGSLYPGLRAANMDPIEALSYE